jgi:predicted protein tyrosine phosphatase
MIKYLMSYVSSLYTSTSQRHRGAQPNGAAGVLSVDWVLPGRVAVGALPRVSDADVLEKAGIRAVLALCSEGEGAWPMQIQDMFHCHRISIPDSHYTAPITPQQIAIAVNHIQHCVEQNLPVFVHCLAGVERSPTICTAYLCRHHYYPLWESLNWVKSVHPESLPSTQQLQAIRKYLAIACNSPTH